MSEDRAPDLGPEDVPKLARRGWSGPLDDHGVHAPAASLWSRLRAAFRRDRRRDDDSRDAFGRPRSD